MILRRAPVRITLGGGTDLASYYAEHEGFLIAGTINCYVYIALNRRFNSSYRLSYSKTEIVESIKDIEHRIFKSAFELMKVGQLNCGIEAVSIADIPANCGLGSSSSFTVALLNGSHHFDRFGELLNEHWEFKKQLSTKVTDPFIDQCYQTALKHGAKGGKLIGAGGGGFFLFYCPENQAVLSEKMKSLGLAIMPFQFEFEGAKIMASIDHN